MPGWSAWTESEPVTRAIKLRNTTPSDEDGSTPCAEYVFITCPHCEFPIESTKKSVKKNKSLLCRSHLAKCPKRPSDTPTSDNAECESGATQTTTILATTAEIDLPPSKRQQLAVVQHRDCIARQRVSDDRISALEQKFRVIEDVIVSCIPGTRRPLDGDSLRLAIRGWTPPTYAPHPRIHEVAEQSAITTRSEQTPQSAESLAAVMLPQLKEAVVDGLKGAGSTEYQLYNARQYINRIEGELATLKGTFDNTLKEKDVLEQKLAKVAQGDRAFIAQLQGRQLPKKFKVQGVSAVQSDE